MYTKDGFHKALEQKLGDDAYLLLAAGGHKKLAELLTSASLGASGNNTTLSITVGGTTKTGSVTVPYASKAGTWETERTLTIGSTGKSVNGSANVTWSLDEIGVYSKTTADDRYLQLSGGTMTGSISSNARNILYDINGNYLIEQIKSSSENYYSIGWGSAARGGWEAIYAGKKITFSTGTTLTTRMTITSDGNIGIGTDSPTAKLDIRSGSVLIDAFNTGNENGIFFRRDYVSSNKYNCSILAYDHNQSGVSPDGISINGYDGVSFCTGSNSRQERMRVDINGNVGIGTTSPSYKLDVSGSANATTLYENGSRVITTANISSQSVNYANSAGNADTIDGYHYNNLPYHPWFKDSSLDANSAGVGWHDVANSITNAAHSNHSSLIYVSNVGTPYQLQIPDSSVLYIYKRWYSGGWSSWSKISAGYADSAGSVAWGNVTGKPASKTIWGQTYVDSSGNLLNVSGNITTDHHYMDGYLYMKFGGSWLSTIDNDGNGPIFGHALALNNRRIYVTGSPVYICGGSYSNYASGITINSSNNVGIGTTSPSVKFEVNNTARILHRLNIGYNVGDWDANRAQLELITEGNDANDFWLGTNSARRWDFSVRSSSESYVLRLYNQDLTNTVTIQQDGTILFSTGFKFIPGSDIPENSGNLASYANTHATTFYRNGLLIPYQMDNANDGGFLRVRGTSESNCIFELGTWDDSGGGETIQFNYYPTTSTVTPTYSLYVPKANGHLLYASNGTIAGFRNEGTSNRTYYWGFNGGSAETYAVHYTNMQVGYASSAGNADTVDGYHYNNLPYHPINGSWKPSSLSSYTRHWGWAYSSAEAGLASNGSDMQIYTDGRFWQREGAYYCLDNGNTYVSSGTGVINGTTITQVSNSDTVDNEHSSAFAHIGAHNNLTASGNEFTTASSGFSGAYYWNYRTAGGLNGNITEYILGKGNGQVLGTIIHSGNWSSYISATISKSTSLSGTTYVVGTSSNQSTFSTCYYVTQFYFTSSGAYHTSDMRKKYDIRDIYTDEVTRLFNTDNAFIRHFKWKESNKDAYGFIAQELAEYCPEAVDLNNDTGYYAVNYNVAFSKIIGAMYKRIKDLERRLEKKENH